MWIECPHSGAGYARSGLQRPAVSAVLRIMRSTTVAISSLMHCDQSRAENSVFQNRDKNQDIKATAVSLKSRNPPGVLEYTIAIAGRSDCKDWSDIRPQRSVFDMANVAFDTLTASKDLQSAGIEVRQAEAIALVVKNSQGDLATKSDIDHLRTELKSDIDNLRTELKSDIDHLRTELKSDIDNLKSESDHLRTELKSDIDHLRTELKSDILWLKWSIAIMAAIMLGGFSVIISLLP